MPPTPSAPPPKLNTTEHPTESPALARPPTGPQGSRTARIMELPTANPDPHVRNPMITRVLEGGVGEV